MRRIVQKYVTFSACLFLEQGVSRQQIRSVSNLINRLPTAMRTLSVDNVVILNPLLRTLDLKVGRSLLVCFC